MAQAMKHHIFTVALVTVLLSSVLSSHSYHHFPSFPPPARSLRQLGDEVLVPVFPSRREKHLIIQS